MCLKLFSLNNKLLHRGFVKFKKLQWCHISMILLSKVSSQTSFNEQKKIAIWFGVETWKWLFREWRDIILIAGTIMLKTHFNWPYLSATSKGKHSITKTDEFSKKFQKSGSFPIQKNVLQIFLNIEDIYMTVILDDCWDHFKDPNTSVGSSNVLDYIIEPRKLMYIYLFLAVYIIKSMLCCRDDFNFHNCFSWIFKSIIGSCGTVMIHLSWTGPL